MSTMRRILLVEDDPRDAEMTVTALDDYHLANGLIHVRDGAEALDYLHGRGAFAGRVNDAPAVVLLDLKMPRVGGIEVLRELKSHPVLRSIPVVVMTSSREEPDLRACYELGANAYVVKPVQFLEFVEAVKQLGTFWAILNQPVCQALP